MTVMPTRRQAATTSTRALDRASLYEEHAAELLGYLAKMVKARLSRGRKAFVAAHGRLDRGLAR